MKERRVGRRKTTYLCCNYESRKAFYMTESEGYNFQTGMNKYPSRFLWEIKDNLYVRQGILLQEIIDAAKNQIEFERNY
jgi:DNA helicase-2/ATP-dependent DNA helicase PcrA